MRMRSVAAVAALVVGAVTIGSGLVYAEPAAPSDGIRYSVKAVDKTVVASLRGGTFALTERDGATPDAPKTQIANIKDDKGATVLSFPLDYRVEGTPIPVQAVAKQDGTVLEITPERPANAPAVTAPLVVTPIASPAEDQLAMNEFSSKLGVATQVGGLVGSIIGFAIGCVATLPLGCILGGAAAVPVGGVIGTIVAGGPALVAAGMDLLQTMQAAPGASKWANDGRPAPQN
ncbi:hypothetical protein [Nocardia arthritidis]|uniref:DUF8020 domain-containing protein n=1 Tax=Nocardia arthritidis TaxID=228602 RepID=A0A6G9Y653_9NOCA|nr:hypothetical protein [Nocardia arthritidis]QIS08533.1 hypothetical protein F5544_03070 [Nocardia arthritidis]